MKSVKDLLGQNAEFQLTWIELECTERNNSIRIRVTSDAVKHEDVRIAVTAREHQMLADHLEAHLPTAKICDMIHARADIKIDFVDASTIQSDQRGTDLVTERSKEVDRRVDAELMQLGADGRRLQDGREHPLISNTCLNWVLSAATGEGEPTRAVRHGHYSEEAPNRSSVMPWLLRCHYPEDDDFMDDDQGVSLVHGARLVHREIQVAERHSGGVRWRTMSLETAFMHPAYGPLLHHGARPLRYTRIPTVQRPATWESARILP